MTKPSSFIINSDYLSIAQMGHNQFTAAFSGGTAASGAKITSQLDFTATTQAGAIDRIMIRQENTGPGTGTGDFILGAHMLLCPTYVNANDYIEGFLSVFRISSSTVRASLNLINYATSSLTYPNLTFTIKVSTFKPPNVF